MKPALLTATAVCATIAIAGCGSSSSTSSAHASSTSTAASTGTSGQQTVTAQPAGQLGFEGMPIEQGAPFAPASSTGTGTVDGITCGPTEQLAYHIHAHLSVYVGGKPRSLPGGIGIPGSTVVQSSEGPVAAGGQCIYWLHTHAPDGVIHIESPSARIYTLGNFFDEWRQPLSATQVGTASGKVTALYNGKPWTKDVRSIPLQPHAEIQLDVGSPIVAFAPVSFAGTGL